jgi:kanamycin kinase
MLAGTPGADRTPPRSVVQLAGGREIRPVWENEIGGLIFDVGLGADRCFVKWAPRHEAHRLHAEVVRLEWASPYTPVPVVIDAGDDAEGAWMVTRPLPGTSAVSPRWSAKPTVAARAIGEGLRAFHDALPVAECPFGWSVEERIADAHRRANHGLLDPARWHEPHCALDVDGALRLLADPPKVEGLVVCHGDACAPNTLLTPDGKWCAHVDLGALGVADRWADLAIATWNLEWNYGPQLHPVLLDAYGIEPDPERTRYYRLLWELGP